MKTLREIAAEARVGHVHIIEGPSPFDFAPCAYCDSISQPEEDNK